jgi:hypothetical protein
MRLFEIDDRIEALLHEGVDPETGEISEECLAELEALEESKRDKLLALACVVRGEEEEAEAVKRVMAGLKSRVERHQRKAESLLEYIKAHADPSEKIRDDRVELVWRRSQAVVIDKAAEVPADCLRHKPKPAPEPDKPTIAARLKAGTPVPGCHLERRISLKIK